MTVLAASYWKTNADMIVDVVRLGYIRPTDRVIDLTFGRGKWWTKYACCPTTGTCAPRRTTTPNSST
jgi:hypothetical protein